MQGKLKDELRKVFKQVSRNFFYEKDFEEHWEMPPQGYNGKQELRDDCDGFCLGCRVLLRQAQIPSRLVYCEVEDGGHLVVEVEGWILDVLQDKVVSNNSFRLKHYHWLRISGYEPGDPWREIVSPTN